MLYILICAPGQSELMAEASTKMEIWVTVITSLWFIWLTVLPLIVGICLRNLTAIQWKRKWIWIYFLPLTACFLWLLIDEGSIGGVLEGIVISLIPVVYWSIYERKKRSLIQLILDDREVIWYLRYAVFMIMVMAIGLKDISTLKLLGLILLPPLFYVMLVRSMNLGVILTRCCIALSVVGLLYWLILDCGLTLTVIYLSIALILILFVSYTIFIRTRNRITPVVLIFALPIIIIPGIMGMNPYTVTDADHTRMYLTNLSVKQGVYVVEKYIESAEEGQPYHWSRKYGLRDRYGLIIPIEYDELKPLDHWGRYLITKSNLEFEYKNPETQLGVFDLRERRFIINPRDIEISEILKIDDNSFSLIDSNGRYFATLFLPGEHDGVYYPNPHLEPHFAQDEVSVSEFINLAETVDYDVDNDYWEIMLQENPQAYKLIIQMTVMGSEKSSPASDLNFAKALREIIQRDAYYKGNIEKAFDEVETTTVTLTDSGSQAAINEWTEYLRLISSARTSLTYDSLFSLFPDNELLREEYIAWHNLIEAMAYYQDYIYSIQYYRGVPTEKNLQIIKWLDYRRDALEKEREIISGNLTYSITSNQADTMEVKRKYDEFFSIYHSSKNPYYYDPMWNEVKAAFDTWTSVRMKVAEQLEPSRALSYSDYSKEVSNHIFTFIEELERPEFIPAM